jgi:polyisoprenyl-phosphate glycosyltransferase
MVRVALVIPCYNESVILTETAKRVQEVLSDLAARGVVDGTSCVYFIDDGSTDGTWEFIERLAREESRFRGIKLSRNCGHQNALLAGLMTAEGDVLISLDADLQDDLRAIDKMLQAHQAGAEIVFGVRASRQADTLLKRFTAEIYYWLLTKLGVEIVNNHADYRLMSRRAIEELKAYTEVNLFLRGLVPLLGFRTEIVRYDRRERFGGNSKYAFRQMLSLAVNGITSLSIIPLRVITLIGFSVSFLTFILGLWVMLARLLVPDATVPGWASTVLPIYFIGGIQLVSLGIVGEYVGRIYLETKRRPRYIIEKLV